MTRKAFVLLVVCGVAFAQGPAHLRDIKTIYVNQLGDGDGAPLVREKLIANLAGKFQVVDSPEKADVEVVGRGEIFRSAASTNVDFPALTDSVAAILYGAKQKRELERQRIEGIPVLAIHLVDRRKNIVWAYDSTADKKNDGVAKSLQKAIDREPKSRKF